jgi:small subunit ribosomal protein S3
MGQKVNPHSFRLGISKDWDSRWFVETKDKNLLSQWIYQDYLIRKVLEKECNSALVSLINIERNKEKVIVNVFCARPKLILSQEKAIEKLIRKTKQQLKERKLNLEIRLLETFNPDINATIIAKLISRKIVSSPSFALVQRFIKELKKQAFRKGAKGMKIFICGRIGGADKTKKYFFKEKSIPLSTIDSNINYAQTEALINYGIIGVKVWIYKGLIKNIKKN